MISMISDSVQPSDGTSANQLLKIGVLLDFFVGVHTDHPFMAREKNADARMAARVRLMPV